MKPGGEEPPTTVASLPEMLLSDPGLGVRVSEDCQWMYLGSLLVRNRFREAGLILAGLDEERRQSAVGTAFLVHWLCAQGRFDEALEAIARRLEPENRLLRVRCLRHVRWCMRHSVPPESPGATPA